MLAESLAAEAAREIERLLGADATQTLGDFEAAETAVRTAVLAVAARFVAERLNADHSDQHAAGLPCRCGHTARYAGRRAKTIRTALGAMTLDRAYYHCESCRTGFCPRDRTLGTRQRGDDADGLSYVHAVRVIRRDIITHGAVPPSTPSQVPPTGAG